MKFYNTQLNLFNGDPFQRISAETSAVKGAAKTIDRIM